MSRVDIIKFNAFKEIMGIEFGSPYIIGKAPGDSLIELSPSSTEDNAEMSQMEAIKEKLEEMIKENGLQDKVHIFLDERGLVIRVAETLFFPTGSAEINPNGKETLNMLGKIIKTMPNYVRVEGHTDNVPIHNRQYKSNWELSVIRATNVVKQLITGAGYNPNLLSATGYGEYRPIATNETAEGRQLNRRVDIVIIRTALNKSEPTNNEYNNE